MRKERDRTSESQPHRREGCVEIVPKVPGKRPADFHSEGKFGVIAWRKGRILRDVTGTDGAVRLLFLRKNSVEAEAWFVQEIQRAHLGESACV